LKFIEYFHLTGFKEFEIPPQIRMLSPS